MLITDKMKTPASSAATQKTGETKEARKASRSKSNTDAQEVATKWENCQIPDGEHNATLSIAVRVWENRKLSWTEVAQIVRRGADNASNPDGLVDYADRLFHHRGTTGTAGDRPEWRQQDGQSKASHFRAHNIWDEKPQIPKWLVTDYIPEASIVEIFGETNTGKTFLGIELAACVASGIPFFGHAVTQGGVLYIANEGSVDIINRLKVWQQARGIKQRAPLFRSDTPIELINPKTADTILKFIKADMADNPPKLIVIDTWSRSLGGDDASNLDTTKAIHTLDLIRQEYPEIAILIIHHTGLNEKNRARGASALKAAVEAEFKIALTGDNLLSGKLVLECTKMRSAGYTAKRSFTTRPVVIPSEHGEQIDSLVLEPCDNDPDTKQKRLAKSQQRIVVELEKSGGKAPMVTLRGLFGEKRSTFSNAMSELKEKRIIEMNEQDEVILLRPPD